MLQEEQMQTHEQMQEQEQEQTQPIYRYKFEEQFMIELYNFSKIHQYDDRKEFKSAWNVWTEENTELIEHETRRLTNLNYDGDVKDKMFRSARYYFRKKSPEKNLENKTSQLQQAPAPRLYAGEHPPRDEPVARTYRCVGANTGGGQPPSDLYAGEHPSRD